MYMHQQPPTGLSYAGAAGFNTTFPQYQPAPQQQQQQLLRQFQPPATHNPYAQQPTQIMPMNPAAGGMTILDASMLQGTTPPNISYMTHHQSIQQPVSTGSQQIQTAKAPSKAIKIVNPNTMKEVDTTNLNVNKATSSPVSSARSTPKPESEQQVLEQFKQTVQGVMSTTNDDVTSTQPTPPIATVTPLMSGHDVTTTVVADSSTDLASTTSTDEKPKPSITPPVSDVSHPLTSESVHQKKFVSEVAVTKDTASSEMIAKEEGEVVSEELTNVSDTSKSSEAQVEQSQPPPEASKKPLLPEQQKVEVNSSSVSHEDSKGEETEEVNQPDIKMDIKEVDDTLSEQKSIVYKPDGVELTGLQQQGVAENMEGVAEEDKGDPLTSDVPPSSEGKQHASEKVLVPLVQMESGGDEPEEGNKDLPVAEEKAAKEDNGMH